MNPRKLPSYRLHKPSGQAVVSLPLGGGHRKDYYLGAWDSPESHAEYRRIIAEYLASGPIVPRSGSPVTVNELAAAYTLHAKTYYTKGGKPTRQYDRVRYALDPVTRLYGHLSANDFGPRALKAVQAEMVRLDWARGYVNSCLGCVKRAWKWAVSEELASESTYAALCLVENLHQGRTSAKESEKVRPVPPEHVEAAKPYLLPPLRAVVELQLATAMRPGEALAVCPGDIDRSGDVWLYRPESHKTEHHDKERTILIGPEGQAVLAPWLDRDPQAYCFSPREAVQLRLAELGRRVKHGRGREPGERYQVTSYAHAVRLACQKAGVPPFHPHRLRHTAATRIRSLFDADTAKIILGHSTIDMTLRYAEDDLAKAAAAMRQAG